jgi:hypothetical protein
VALFLGGFETQRNDLLINDWVPNKRHVVPSSQYDKTSAVLYNLPVGTVMTLLDGGSQNTTKIADLSDCGTCVDLVGTGKTEGCTVIPLGFNDKISLFFWRTVDLNMGAIELFDAANFTGRQSTIFLSEWPQGQVHSIQRWQLQDTITSVRWKTLQDRQTAELYDGGGNDAYGKFSNIKGWGSTKEVANLSDFRMNDCVTSFMWDSVDPIKEIIKPFNITASNITDGSGLTSHVSGNNIGTGELGVKVALTNTTAQTVTLETSDQHVFGVSASVTQTATAGVEGIASASTQWTVGVSYSYQRAETKTTSVTTTVDLAIEQTVNVPPRSSYKATMLVSIGSLPATEYFTTAQRWYVNPVSGSQVDPSNNNWYKRVEDVRLTMSGTLACRTQINLESTPLPPGSTPPS